MLLVFSGGFNAIVQSWDVVKRKALATLPCRAPSAQLINPAFIHRVSASAEGSFVAAALGDGSVIVAESATLNPLMRLDEVAGHKSAVSQVYVVCVCIECCLCLLSALGHFH